MQPHKLEIVNEEYRYPKNRPFLMSAELEEVTRHFNKLEAGQEKMHSQMGMMEDSIREVKGAVIGNPPMGQKGLAQRMEDVEEWIHQMDIKGIASNIEKTKVLEDRIRAYDKMLDQGWGAKKAIIGIWTLVGGFVGYVITLILKKYGL